MIVAAEARTGSELWRYRVGAPAYTAVTYMIEDRQYLTLAAGSTLTAFALPREATR